VLGDPDPGDPDGDRFAALMQGVAFVARLCFDYLDLLGAPVGGDLVLTGGATRSRYWCQLRADVLGRPVRLPRTAEPALGMAVLAASPGRRTAEVAARMVAVETTIDPRPDRAGRFDHAYLALVDALETRGWLPSRAAAHARRRTADRSNP
jgi:sugar (pentulose or hexulose) kinase